jgi:uncharacterized protein with von Willebrand factor type A (vWA) domain
VPSALLDALQGFVQELRAAGLPVSMTEDLDAMGAIGAIDLTDREVVRAALAATLVKSAPHRAAFDIVFDLYFGVTPIASDEAEGGDGLSTGPTVATAPASKAGPDAVATRAELLDALVAALGAMDRDALRRLVARAVEQFAGMEPGRPVGGTYYLYRTLRQLDLEGLALRLMDAATGRGEVAPDALAARLAEAEFAARLRELRALIEGEIRRRLVADRGAEAMARTLRRPLPEDIDFMHASREEMLGLQRSIRPLARVFAARLARRRRRRHGHLDFRRTVRASLSYGGVPAEPKFRTPHPSKPEIMLLADVSGSVASFARFTLQLVYAIADEFSKVRAWVFVDGIDEVTRFFQESDDLDQAIGRVNTEADVVWADGHSDYGHAFEVFHRRHGNDITPRTSVIVLGDARNNYHAAQASILHELRQRARHLYWLNPEPRTYWDTGDSIASQYAVHCDGVFECRTLRQLEHFVTAVAGV